MSLGFARDHRSSEAYVCCILCRCDLKVESRGISTYLEHCRVVIHHKLDSLVRSRHGLFLRRPTGSVMSATEPADMEKELRGLSVPDVEVCPAFSVREVFAVQARGDSILDSGVPDNERSLRLFLCSNWEIVAVLEELRESWQSLVTLVERLDWLSGSENPSRVELLVLQAGLASKFHAVGLVYTIGYY